MVVVTSRGGSGVYSIEKRSENVVTRAKGGGDASRSLQTERAIPAFSTSGSRRNPTVFFVF